MYCIGSTSFATQYPRFFHGNKWFTLPRPYETSKPGGKATLMLEQQYWRNIIQDIEYHVFEYIEQVLPTTVRYKIFLNILKLCKIVIPSSCRINDSIFSHMTILGNGSIDGEGIPCHLDEKDIISVVLHLGEVKYGGFTKYYNGSSIKNKGELKKSIPFQHGRIQIGFFNQIIHEVSSWKGQGTAINFNLKRDVFFSFLQIRSYVL